MRGGDFQRQTRERGGRVTGPRSGLGVRGFANRRQTYEAVEFIYFRSTFVSDSFESILDAYDTLLRA